MLWRPAPSYVELVRVSPDETQVAVAERKNIVLVDRIASGDSMRDRRQRLAPLAGTIGEL